MSDETIQVKILLTNGQTKTGVLLNGLQSWLSQAKVFKFVSNTDYETFQKTNNNNLVEHLTENQVKGVDTFLR